MDLTMKSDRLGKTESGVEVPIGTVVEYMGHVSGGAVRVRLPSGSEEVMSPLCFAQLR